MVIGAGLVAGVGWRRPSRSGADQLDDETVLAVVLDTTDFRRLSSGVLAAIAAAIGVLRWLTRPWEYSAGAGDFPQPVAPAIPHSLAPARSEAVIRAGTRSAHLTCRDAMAQISTHVEPEGFVAIARRYIGDIVSARTTARHHVRRGRRG